MSVFSVVPAASPVEIFHLNKLASADTFAKKVNLTVGAYRDEKGQPWVLPVVRKADKIIGCDQKLNKEYLPMLGMESFRDAATKLVLGEKHPAVLENRAFGVQCLSGTGSLRMGAAFLSTVLGRKLFYCSDPTWENHRLVFNHAGFTEARDYKYWDAKNRNLRFDDMVRDLCGAPANAVIILHACAHNPTGCDLTQEQWQTIASVCKYRKLFPFLDIAYQGFATGSLENDSWAVRHFADEGLEFICAQSFAKNMGLYNERIGNLTFVMKDPQYAPQIKSQVEVLARAMYSNPPSHGARIAHLIMTNNELKKEWQQNIVTMATRVQCMRKLLRSALEKVKAPGDWKHITNQIGMFSYTGLNEKQCELLTNKLHVYLLKSGRINMCAITPDNVDYVAEAMKQSINDAK